MPPCHRILGFILIVLSTIANFIALFHFTNLFATLFLVLGFIFFSLFTYYTFIFLIVEHYIDEEQKHISNTYIKMIQSDKNKFLRNTIFIIYFIIYGGSYILPAYFHESFNGSTTWQKTMISYNYFMTSFTIMYFYEHRNMDKYLSLNNVQINENDYITMPDNDLDN